jgi:hypothetical protein
MGIHGKRRPPSWEKMVERAVKLPPTQPERITLRVPRGEMPPADEVSKLVADGFELVATSRVGYGSAELDFTYERRAARPASRRQDAADARTAPIVQPTRRDRS